MSKKIDAKLELGQNFPNPVYNDTTILYAIKIPNQVAIEIWNLKGIKVAEIVNLKHEEGNYKVKMNFDEANIAPGNYIVK